MAHKGPDVFFVDLEELTAALPLDLGKELAEHGDNRYDSNFGVDVTGSALREVHRIRLEDRRRVDYQTTNFKVLFVVLVRHIILHKLLEPSSGRRMFVFGIVSILSHQYSF
jgi:hypothetical protein